MVHFLLIEGIVRYVILYTLAMSQYILYHLLHLNFTLTRRCWCQWIHCLGVLARWWWSLTRRWSDTSGLLRIVVGFQPREWLNRALSLRDCYFVLCWSLWLHCYYIVIKFILIIIIHSYLDDLDDLEWNFHPWLMARAPSPPPRLSAQSKSLFLDSLALFPNFQSFSWKCLLNFTLLMGQNMSTFSSSHPHNGQSSHLFLQISPQLFSRCGNTVGIFILTHSDQMSIDIR